MRGLIRIFAESTCQLITGPGREKTCLRGFANNKSADQSALTRSLISAFVSRLFESIVFRHATREISMFKLVSVTEETGLNLTFLETPKTGFPVSQANLCWILAQLCKQRISIILTLFCFSVLFSFSFFICFLSPRRLA